jgi:hypothetical protein
MCCRLLAFMVCAVCCEFRVLDGTSASRHPVQYASRILISISDGLIPTVVLNSEFCPTSGLPLYLVRVVVAAGWESPSIIRWLVGYLTALGSVGLVLHWLDLSSLSEAGSEQTGSRARLLSRSRWTSLTRKAVGYGIRKGSLDSGGGT